ncbi:MAG: XTP/dITP diphosphatase [Thermoplasmata archaeon]
MKIRVVTHNKHKYDEYKLLFENENVETEWINMEYVEIQDNDIENIALYSLNILKDNVEEPYIMEDSGLFIESLNGFPGPYSSYVNKTIGNEGILKLMEGKKNRDAEFIAIIGLRINGENYLFKGKTEGIISSKISGNKGFGYDPIFIPKEQNKTFAEMEIDEKNMYSHRMKAFKNLIRFLQENNFL